MRISDWSSDVCSSDLRLYAGHDGGGGGRIECHALARPGRSRRKGDATLPEVRRDRARPGRAAACERSEEHTSELQSLMRISYAVFCLKKKTTKVKRPKNNTKPDTTIRSCTN